MSPKVLEKIRQYSALIGFVVYVLLLVVQQVLGLPFWLWIVWFISCASVMFLVSAGLIDPFRDEPEVGDWTEEVIDRVRPKQREAVITVFTSHQAFRYQLPLPEGATVQELLNRLKDSTDGQFAVHGPNFGFVVPVDKLEAIWFQVEER